MHHLKDSTMFDFPQPFGPTIPVRPLSIINVVFSANDLKPFSWIFLNSIWRLYQLFYSFFQVFKV